MDGHILKASATKLLWFIKLRHLLESVFFCALNSCFYFALNTSLCEQTVATLIQCHILFHMISVCTVYLFQYVPISGFPDNNWLKLLNFKQFDRNVPCNAYNQNYTNYSVLLKKVEPDWQSRPASFCKPRNIMED